MLVFHSSQLILQPQPTRTTDSYSKYQMAPTVFASTKLSEARTPSSALFSAFSSNLPRSHVSLPCSENSAAFFGPKLPSPSTSPLPSLPTATWSLVLPWLWEEWELGFKEQGSPAGISDTHLLVQVQLGPVVLAVTGSEAGVGDIWWERLLLPGCWGLCGWGNKVLNHNHSVKLHPDSLKLEHNKHTLF